MCELLTLTYTESNRPSEVFDGTGGIFICRNNDNCLIGRIGNNSIVFHEAHVEFLPDRGELGKRAITDQ